jgi:hypothetical protein
VHDLRGKKIFAFEVARAQNIREFTKAVKTQKQRIELDSASDTDPFDDPGLILRVESNQNVESKIKVVEPKDPFCGVHIDALVDCSATLVLQL